MSQHLHAVENTTCLFYGNIICVELLNLKVYEVLTYSIGQGVGNYLEKEEISDRTLQI
jgi:hypothetical protein